MENKRLLVSLRKVLLGLTLILCVGAAALSGCTKKAAVEGKTQKGYSLPEIMVIAMAEKNRYEAVCTGQIWGVEVPGENVDFETYLSEQIKNFMDEMKIMSLLAAEKKVVLSAEESSAMSEAAEEYYGKLTKEDIAYMGVTKEIVREVFEDYGLANKLVEELSKEANLEVSDSEAKVITLMEVKTNSKEMADGLWLAAAQENADFQLCAKNAGLAVTTRQLGRAEESKVLEDAAFALQTGMMSAVIEDDGSYYVLKCVDDYDEEATKARKQIIYEERKRKAFEDLYSGFRKDIELSYQGEPWRNLDLSGDAHAKEADFFDIYAKYEW